MAACQGWLKVEHAPLMAAKGCQRRRRFALTEMHISLFYRRGVTETLNERG